jgi:translation initiation factor 3 subunit G
MLCILNAQPIADPCVAYATDLLPQRTESEPDKNGVRTIVEWKLNEAGHKVKVTKKVKTVTEVTKVSKRALERKQWAKFGAALNSADSSNVTYTSFEDVSLEDPNADQVLPGEKKEEENIFAGVKNSSIVVCRHCGMVGDHWTLKCPYKDTPIDEIPTDPGSRAGGDNDASAASGAGGGSALDGAFGSGKYVPPSLRGRAGLSSSDARNEESQDDRDSATLRVTNISPDTREDDLKDLFRAFGPVARVYLAKDRETFQSRGFAFVSFMYREDAERAMNKLQGYGYDHLILKIEWAKPSNKPAGESQDPGSMSTTFRSGYGKALPQNVAPPPRK